MTIEISNQLSEVLSVIERHLESTLLAVHLYGSAVDGGLKPYSDIDLLVTVAVKRRCFPNQPSSHNCPSPK